MKKNSGYIALGILFAVFSVVEFAAPIEKTSTFWVAYAFAVAAMAFQIPAIKKALSNLNLKSIFMGYPLLYISVAYLAAQLVASLAFMLMPNVSVWAAAIVSIVLLGLTSQSVLSQFVSVGNGSLALDFLFVVSFFSRRQKPGMVNFTLASRLFHTQAAL